MIGGLIALIGAAAVQPSSKWIVDFADNSCVLSRRFGTGDNQFTTHFKAPLMGDNYEVLLVVPERRATPETSNDGWIEKPDGRRVGPFHVNSYSTVAKTRMSRFNIDPDLYKLGEDGDRLIVHPDAERRYDMALPTFAEARAVLETCLKGLRKDHGVDEAALAQIATPAEPAKKVYSLFSTNDYPGGEVKAGGQGNVGALFWVEPNGRVRECKVIETSHREPLDEQTCKILRARARYKPALDTAGKPMRSPLYVRIRWRMPE